MPHTSASEISHFLWAPHHHPHSPLTPLLSISDVWRCASENFFFPRCDWQKPLLCPSPPGSRHFCPVPASIADPAVKHVHISRFFGGVDMQGQYVFRQRWRPSWEDADVLICVSGKPSRQLWSGFWWIYMCRWDLVASLNSYMLIAILIKDETGSSGVILASLP